MPVLIVTYHGLSTAASPVTVTARELAEQLRALRGAGYAFVTLDEIAAWIAGRRGLPALAAAVTFDDGYASVVEEALPILVESGVRATVFAIAGRLGADNAWPGQPRWVPAMPLAGPGGLRSLVAHGMSVGAHSWSHVRLTRLDPGTLRREVVEAGDRLEQVVGARIDHFAYPLGDYGAREVALALTRYKAAYTAGVRAVTPDVGVGAVPRIDAHDLRWAIALRLLASPLLGRYLALRRAGRALRRGGVYPRR